ncbi:MULTISPECIES: hypothetical protein [unclassified Paraburkholderia]|uniref:hypothetical protein n=1 Tax=unclassified Paraburkholderia TaxID=2615204 RepID=UPI0016168ACB|nr:MULTISPECIES: hypothetical protein [unclassified Paraburkholderia]MBB5443254.1 putative ArsR family transcriptional regulator [Paraburkholderia sp. WSM4177]MBB5483140.1 putative ArsR family transcriptional regulator [Paraburkholderia sp. WSM4180]
MTAEKYIFVTANGRTQRMRNPIALRADIVALLTREGAMGKRSIINTLSVGQDSVAHALDCLLAEGVVERYRTMSVRNRMDQLWCIAGQSPVKQYVRFNGAETLAAFQRAAAVSPVLGGAL